MKRVTLNKVTPLLAMTIALFLQGCGGSGGESSSPAVQTSSAATGSGTGITSSKVGIHPASGLAGAAVAISGNGFADACGVALFLDKTGGHSLVDGKISNGIFNVQAVLPESTVPGELMIVGELLKSDGQGCTQSTSTTFETSFTVTGSMPIIELGILEGRPGTAVDVGGRGFCPDAECSPVTVLIDGQVAAPGVTVEDDGTFNAGAIVPAIDAAGLVGVVAVQTDADGSQLRGFGELIVTVRPNEDTPVIQ